MVDEHNLLFRLAAHPVIQGTAAALVIGLAGTLLLSLIFFSTPLSEAYLIPSGNVLYLAGAFFGGFVSAKKAGRKGMQYGAETGLCYFIIIAVIILFFAAARFSCLDLVLKGVYTLIAATIGGIFGIAFAE